MHASDLTGTKRERKRSGQSRSLLAAASGLRGRGAIWDPTISCSVDGPGGRLAAPGEAILVARLG